MQPTNIVFNPLIPQTNKPINQNRKLQIHKVKATNKDTKQTNKKRQQ
jgi:hypothetical protein